MAAETNGEVNFERSEQPSEVSPEIVSASNALTSFLAAKICSQSTTGSERLVMGRVVSGLGRLKQEKLTELPWQDRITAVNMAHQELESIFFGSSQNS